MKKSRKPVAPGEGERRALRGYVRQYESTAAVIYAALEHDDLIWVGLADRDAGVADDVVLGLPGRVVGHQFKTSKFPQPFRLQTLFIGADGLLSPLASAWQCLKNSFPDEAVEIRLVTNDYPSTSDSLIEETTDGHSAAFLREVDLNPTRTLADWRSSRWQPFIDALANSSDLSDQEFEEFFVGLRLLCGPAADFVQAHRLSPEGARLAGEIANLLPRLVADVRDKDRWSRAELLAELSWRDSFALRRSHQFPVGAYVQRNIATEQALRSAIQNLDSGYVALVGAPGAGKSTLLQTSVATEPGFLAVRYLAFVPGQGQGLGRGEAEDFLDDLNAQLKHGGLKGMRFRDTTLHERREQFEHLLKLAGERFHKDGVRTLIVVDGLDHIPREERPDRSLLAELPLPSSLPAGVLFVLGTQRLDLIDLKPAVQQQALLPERHVVVAPLSREAVYRMTEAFGLDSDVPREQIFELCLGQPLVTRYLLEALRDADVARRQSLLAGDFTFAGDIDVVYESAWRAIEDDDAAREVMGYIARAEAPIHPELLAQAVSEPAVERALASTRHLLSLGSQGWNVFHNSFRLFILSKPRLRFDKPDPGYSPGIYRRLAELARVAAADSPQRWLELRYLARARQHAEVLALATPARFRQQLADARPAADIQADIRLAFAAAKETGDATLVFRLLLASDEISRRATALEYAVGLVDAMLAIGDIDGAQAFAEANGGGAYKVVDALLQAGDVDRARTLFDRIEPLGQLLGGQSNDLNNQEDELRQWAERVFHFREADQIEEAIQRLSTQETSTGWAGDNAASLGERLRFDVARAAMVAQPASDPSLIANQLKVAGLYLPYLFIEAGLSAYEKKANDRARDLLSRAVTHNAFLNVENAGRRRVALVMAQLGDKAMARSIFTDLQPPTIATMDSETGDDVSVEVARAVIEHAELATMLGEPVVEVAPSKRRVLRPLQHHASTVGVVLGRVRAGGLFFHGEVARAARDALAYLEEAQAGGGDEFYAIHQIAAAAPVLGVALARAAALCGEAEFETVVAEFDRSFEKPEGRNNQRVNLRREFVVEVYRCNGDVEAACRRLEPLVSALRENTPEGQVEELAALATVFARVGNRARVRELLRELHSESLGYSLAPKKDPQYEFWRELFERANAADPLRRRERVELMMRQLGGMMETEGYSSARRIASSVLTESVRIDAAPGLAAARVMAAQTMLSWDGIVNALLLGIIRRRPDLAGACVVTWSSLALPYYAEPHYRQEKLGEFISVGIAAATESDVATLVDILHAAIEAESQARTRATLLERLTDAAGQRGLKSARLDEALGRWRIEAPVERDASTPSRYDDVISFDGLEKCFRDENEETLNYEGVAAYTRLVVTADINDARGMFERWPAIQKNTRARFALVERAFSSGEVAFARRLVEGYIEQPDERAAWSHWMGGGKLKYYQARLKLDGGGVHEEAFADLVGELTAGRENALQILLYLEDVLPTIAASPDWPAMWECLAEQLRTTREYAIGKPFEVPDDRCSDESLIISLYRWAQSLSLFELSRHTRTGALHLNSIERGGIIFTALARRLLEGEADEPAEGLRLLSSDVTDMSATVLKDAVAAFVDHPDYAVAIAAVQLSERWGQTVSVSHVELPAFYRLHLDESGDDFDRPSLADPTSGAMRVEDPLGWTFAFAHVIRPLAKKGVSVEHIRYRCRMFIEQWGGLAIFGQLATDKLEAELRRLDMRITYSRPHIVVAARAIRYVAGEMLRAGLIGEQDHPWLLHMMGYPAVRLPVLLPAERPRFVERPSVDQTSWTEKDQRWLADVDDDVRPLITERNTVLAEITRFRCRDIRSDFTLERMRAPFFDICQGEDLSSWSQELPGAVWAENIMALSNEPASTIVRRFSESQMPEMSIDMLVICPHWLRHLGWRRHPENWLIYLDVAGQIVARIVWWRDGGPIDVGRDVVWGEGILVIVTPEGRAKIESETGPLNVQVRSRRVVTPEQGASQITERRVRAAE